MSLLSQESGGSPEPAAADPGRHHHEEAGRTEATAPDDDLALFAEVHQLVSEVVTVARDAHGAPIPGVGTPAWWSAPLIVRLAAVLILGEAYLIANPERIAAEKLKAAAVAISTGLDWSAASRFPSHATIVARRVEPGPLAGDTSTAGEAA